MNSSTLHEFRLRSIRIFALGRNVDAFELVVRSTTNKAANSACRWHILVTRNGTLREDEPIAAVALATSLGRDTEASALVVDINVLVFNSREHAALVRAFNAATGGVVGDSKPIFVSLRNVQRIDHTRQWPGAAKIFDPSLDLVSVRCIPAVAGLRNRWNTRAAAKCWSDVATRKKRATAWLIFVKEAGKAIGAAP